ncbi:MAG: GAF domain-containing protein, partial [Anaerolineae bacterium]|nr:GAF domain-containing protein [Anaerolineae bacterium]
MVLRAVDVQEGSTPGQSQSAEVQIARLEMMLEVSRALNSTLDLDVLLRSIIETATELIETEAASILLIDESKGGDQLHAVTGFRQQDQVTVNVVPLEGSVAGWVIKSGEPITIYDIQQDDRHFSEVDQLAQLEVRGILGVPLTVKNKVIGALEVINKKVRQAIFTGGDLQTL